MVDNTLKLPVGSPNCIGALAVSPINSGHIRTRTARITGYDARNDLLKITFTQAVTKYLFAAKTAQILEYSPPAAEQPPVTFGRLFSNERRFHPPSVRRSNCGLLTRLFRFELEGLTS
ncbi:hypothetical protein MAUB1S_03587 [Mycolicibacterium aubagnense]